MVGHRSSRRCSKVLNETSRDSRLPPRARRSSRDLRGPGERINPSEPCREEAVGAFRRETSASQRCPVRPCRKPQRPRDGFLKGPATKHGADRSIRERARTSWGWRYAARHQRGLLAGAATAVSGPVFPRSPGRAISVAGKVNRPSLRPKSGPSTSGRLETAGRTGVSGTGHRAAIRPHRCRGRRRARDAIRRAPPFRQAR